MNEPNKGQETNRPNRDQETEKKPAQGSKDVNQSGQPGQKQDQEG